MAEAWIAHKGGLGGGRVELCLKLIKREFATRLDFVKGFHDEARVHSFLRHPHIVTVFDSGHEEGPDGRYWLAMELVDGADLRKLMHRLEDAGLRLPYRQAVGIIFPIAQALGYAHNVVVDGVHQHLVHRDVSPSNILLSKQGYAKLTDFGIVKAVTRMTNTESGVMKGKYTYVAPEVLLGKPYDGRADLFALGVILFEIFTGTHPYRKGTDELEVTVMHRIAIGDRPAIRPLAPHVPEDLCATVEALLECNPDKRIPDADTLLDRLAPHVATVVEATEVGRYLKAAREGGPFPSSAIRVGVNSGGGVGDTVTVTRNEAVLAAPPDSPPQHVINTRSSVPVSGTAKVRTGRARDIRYWARWMVPLVAVAAAAALALGSGTSEAPATTGTSARSMEETPEEASSRGPAKSRAEEPASKHFLPPPTPEPTAPPLTAPQTTPEGDDEPGSNALGTESVSSRNPLSGRTAAPSVADKSARPERRTSSHGEEKPRSATCAEKNAWLDVKVQPSGGSWNVWVDGEYCGVADVRVKVCSGRHTVEIGVNRPTVKRGVRVEKGQTRDVPFEL